MILNTTTKFRLLHMFTHTAAFIGLFWMFTTGAYIWALIALIAFLYIGIVGVNVALHRYYSHRSFKTDSFREWVLLVSSFLPMLGSPIAWGSVHVYHHMTTDTDKDPHSPKNAGKFGSWFTIWPKMNIPIGVVKKLSKDKRVVFLHRHYFKLVILYILILFIINPLLVPFLFALPAVGCFHGAAAIGVIPHLSGLGGYRNHDTKDNSYNSWIAWVLSLGEVWHNNHHHRAGNWRSGEKWWELDPPAFVIKHFFKVST